MNLFDDIIYRLTNPNRIYINAYAQCKPTSTNKNWGDDINYWFLREIIKSPIRLYNESPVAFRRNDPNYLVIGSTISLLTKSSSIVWGAGCIDESSLPAIPRKVLAVRGPLTREVLLRHNVDCPEVYGDPALLLPLHYLSPPTKHYKVGFIQHVSEKVVALDGCHNISLSDYNYWTDVIDEINKCDIIASSSLHGLIVAEAYGIPSVWIENDELLGGRFKFNDFFASVGKGGIEPINIKKLSITSIEKYAQASNIKYFDYSPLISSAPFELMLTNDRKISLAK